MAIVMKKISFHSLFFFHFFPILRDHSGRLAMIYIIVF